MEALIAFCTALVTLRLATELAQHRRSTRKPEHALWAAGLASYAIAAGALAWGSAAGWDVHAFRVYYLCGGLLTAALLGAGSLRRIGVTAATPVSILFAGFAIGLVLAEPLLAPVSGTAIPDAKEHLAFLPARLAAVLGNAVGTLALVGVAGVGLRRRPLENTLVLCGVAIAAAGSAVSGLGVAPTTAFIAVAAILLYGGFMGRAGRTARLASSVQTVLERVKGQCHGHRPETG